MTNGTFESPRARRTQLSFEVKLNNTVMMDKIAKWEAKEQLRVVNYASNIDTVSEEDMLVYMKNLLYLRTLMVNNQKIDPAVKAIIKRLYVPARWYTMLDHIGEAHDYGRNIKFFPNYDLPATEVKNADWLVTISEIFAYLRPEGYTCVQGIPTHVDGSIEFMAKVALSDEGTLDTVRGMDVHNPVFGFFAVIFQLQVLNLTYKELELLYRIEYSSGDVYSGQFTDYYRSVMSNATTVESGTTPAQPTGGNV